MTNQPIAIIDIGSNSIRMVVYDGLYRSPAILFNERVLAELGKTLSTTGCLNPNSLELAFDNLQRFKSVIENMNAQYFVIATAALREASDGPAFTERLRHELGLDVQIISGTEEARLGVTGLIATIGHSNNHSDNNLNGISGDLGGGSLELSHIQESQYIQGESLPLGGLRLSSGFSDTQSIKNEIKRYFHQLPWLKDVAKNQNFYPIGGAWRSIAKYYMTLTDYPIHITHKLRVQTDHLMPYLKELAAMPQDELSSLKMISKRRRPVMAIAALLMIQTLRYTGAKEVCFSAFGVREGLLYEQLPLKQQQQDSLLERCKYLEKQFSRFHNGETIYHWSKVITHQDKKKYDRLYKAACYMSDIGWLEHKDYRSEIAFRRIITQRFGGGMDHQERFFLAITIYISYGGHLDDPLLENITPLLSKKQLKKAEAFGTAIRLAQRLGGGPTTLLQYANLDIQDHTLILKIHKKLESFMGLHIEKLLEKLADNMELHSSIDL